MDCLIGAGCFAFAERGRHVGPERFETYYADGRSCQDSGFFLKSDALFLKLNGGENYAKETD